MSTDDHFLEKRDVSGKQFLRNETFHAPPDKKWLGQPRIAGTEAECGRCL